VNNFLQATDLTRPPPVSLTAGNKSFPWQLRSWLPPNKNTTVGALGRAVGSVANSSNPLNTTKAVAQGLALYTQETKALILGQAGIVSFVNSVNISASSGSPITCFVDPSTGQLVGLEQAGLTACSPTGDVTVVPTSAGYISQIKLAYTYDGAFIGRLVFDLKANATAKPVSYTCGSAGGKAVDLLPSKGDFVVTKLGVGCAPLPSVAAGGASGGRRRRRSLSAAEPGTGLSAGSITVAAAALASLPIDPATGVPQTPQLGDVIAPQDGGGGAPTPVPTPTSPPTPPPTTAPPAPVVTPSTATLSSTSSTLVISGANFDPTAAGNVVTLGSGAMGTVTAASSTSLTVTFSAQPSAGALSASVTSFGLSSGTAVVVATVRVPPSVSPSSATLSSISATLVISGANFDPTAAGNVVTLSNGTVGSISSASTTSLTVVFGTLPSSGPLSASVTSFGLSSGAAVQVAIVAPLTVSSGPINLSIPDDNYAGISSTLTVNAAGRVVASVSVTFNIVHTFDRDLIINLKAPNGQVLNLVDRKGGGGDNFINTVISSTATVSVNTGSAPFTGTYSPSAVVPTLAPTAFISTTGVYTQLFSQPSGSWIFAVADIEADDVGILQNWAITLNYA
jgi:subtilisin-like proprotein convertase family protein